MPTQTLTRTFTYVRTLTFAYIHTHIHTKIKNTNIKTCVCTHIIFPLFILSSPTHLNVYHFIFFNYEDKGTYYVCSDIFLMRNEFT